MKKVTLFLLATSLFFVACNNDTKTTSSDSKDTMPAPSSAKLEKNKATALAIAMATNAHDVDGMVKESAADGVDYGDGSMPPLKGIDSVKAGIKMWLMAFPDLHGENFMVLTDDGTHVAVVADWTATFKGDLMGMKATGKAYKARDADIFTFNEEGKVTEHRSIQSNTTLMAQVMNKM